MEAHEDEKTAKMCKVILERKTKTYFECWIFISRQRRTSLLSSLLCWHRVIAHYYRAHHFVTQFSRRFFVRRLLFYAFFVCLAFMSWHWYIASWCQFTVSAVCNAPMWKVFDALMWECQRDNESWSEKSAQTEYWQLQLNKIDASRRRQNKTFCCNHSRNVLNYISTNFEIRLTWNGRTTNEKKYQR